VDFSAGVKGEEPMELEPIATLKEFGKVIEPLVALEKIPVMDLYPIAMFESSGRAFKTAGLG
jgi:hypothetical protein